MSKFWTPDRVRDLHRLFTQGLSGGRIAEEMGPGVTRNMVISKSQREGLFTSPERRAANSKWAVKAGQPRLKPRPQSQSPFRGLRSKTPRTPRTPKAPNAVIHGLTLGTDFNTPPAELAAKREAFRRDGMALVARVESGAGVVSMNARPFRESSGCKWPLANGMVCCNPSKGRVYCPGHDDVAHGRTLAWTPARIDAIAENLTRFDGVVDALPENDTVSEWGEGRAAA